MSGYLDAESFQQASLDVAIPSSNRGYRLLQKMGWQEGGPAASAISLAAT
jgi:hypothetical protein